MKDSDFIQSVVYYNNKFDKSSKFKIPSNPFIHHIICLIISAIIETQYHTFFIIPILLFSLTYIFMINNEFKIRIVQRCLTFETNETGELSKDTIFKSCKDMISSEGLMIYKVELLLKSILFFILVHYATIGFLI
jgi:hypothetical protein